MTTFSVTCPCCKGETRLIVFDENLGCDIPMLCCHCIDGRVPAEVDEHAGEYLRLGIDLANPNPDGSDYHLMNLLDQTVKPHAYFPSAMHMGDCAVCGHIQSSPVHTEHTIIPRTGDWS